MSDPGDEAGPRRAASASVQHRAARRRDTSAVADVCPLLVSADAAWRSAYASREHRCWAVRPPAPLVFAKQRDLCLTANHASCATYLATFGGVEPDDDGLPVVQEGAQSLLWPPVRSTPLALEPSRGRTTAIPVANGRPGGQALLVGLMVLAFLVLVIARTTAPSSTAPSSGASGAAVGASQTPIPAVAVSPSGGTPAGASGSPSSAPSASTAVTPTPRPTPSAGPSVARTYTVQPNDRLETIAARFGTTVKAIAAANGITNPSLIRVGQVLVIP